MAQPALDLFRRRALLVKAETTEGTDSVPTGSSNAILFMDGSSGTEFDTVERPIDRAVFGHDPFSVGNKRAFIEGMFELYPPATPGAVSTSSADCEPLLLPSGFAVVKDLPTKTTRYNPVSTGIPSATAYWYHSGTLIRALGARGNLTQLSMEVGNRFMARARLLGNYGTLESASLPSVTLPSTVPPVIRHTNATAHIESPAGGTPLLVWAKALSVDLGNDLASKEYTSVKFNQISDRRPTWTMRIARTDLADFNPISVRDAGTIIEARIRVFSAASPGLYSELGIRGQIENVTAADIDGDKGFEITGRCIPSSAGGDELYIEFGDTTT